MAYTGENSIFSFRDGFCETLPGVSLTTSDAASLGRTLSGFFRRFSAAGGGFSNIHILYALCSGISECGKDVYVCENSDLPSFRFAFPLLSADCGIYITGGDCLRLSLYDENGSPMSSSKIKEIMSAVPSKPEKKCGRMIQASAFREIYTRNIADSLGGLNEPIPAGVSCGSRSTRSLWLEFFSGEDDTLVFQVSDNGCRVNAYSTQYGFISYEKLVLSYVCSLLSCGQAVYLPDDFHYAADLISEDTGKIIRFPADERIPDEAARQRFLNDPLYMCTHLAAERKKFAEILEKLPQMASAKREISLDTADKLTFGKSISSHGGRIILTRSGRKRVTLLAQAYSAEAASELCSFWTDKLRRNDI